VEIQAVQLAAQMLRSSGNESSSPSVVDSAQSERFHALLGSVATDTPSVAMATTVQSGAPAAAGEAATLGDEILQGLQKLRGGFRQEWGALGATLDPQVGPLSASGVLEAQARVLQLGFEYQMLGGIVSKSAQNIDQLVKMQ
jgi:type III secretion system YscI/HrpB-like protein